MGNSISSMCQCTCNPPNFSKIKNVSSLLTIKKPIEASNLSSQQLEDRPLHTLSSNLSTIEPLSNFPSKKKQETSESEIHKLTAKDFIYEKTLGKGSVGHVLLVRKANGHEFFAMKVMRKSDLQKDQLYENVILEKHILQINKHPFIVHLKHAFQSETKLYFIMEYLPGGDLFSLIRKHKRLLEIEAQFYAAEVLLALEYLHEHMNIIYRDLKPENILISAEGHVKLTDFGLSKQGERGYTFAGTPEYLAPEVFMGKGYTKAVDFWSFGVLLYEMLVGKPPFTNEERNISQLEKIILANRPVFPSVLGKEVIDLIQQLLEINPKKRLDAEQIKKHVFFKDIMWDDLLKLKVLPPIPVEKIRIRSHNKNKLIENSLLEENDYFNGSANSKGLMYLPGISFNETIE